MSIKDIYTFLTRDLWRTTADDLGQGKGFFIGTLKAMILSIKGFNDNDISMRANSLTYSMMFAIVPILALIFAVAKGFGMEVFIEDFLNDSFLKEYGIVDTIMGFVKRYLETAQGGVFIGIGIFILLWAVYSFFRNVESSFNKIWQVNKSRSYVRQFTNYITILILVPILIITSSGVNLMVSSTGERLGLVHLQHFTHYLLQLLPWISSWFIFVLMYKMIPNTKVSIRSTIFPGILIGTLVQALQAGSIYIIMFLSRTSVVYGTFAAVPLLLTWMQWTCLLILLGAEMSYAIQNKEHFDYLDDSEKMSRRYKDYLTIYICYQIIKRFENGEKALTTREIADLDHVPVRIVNQLISRLVEVNILSEMAAQNENDENRYQPALDINKITVGMVFANIDSQGHEDFLKNLPSEMESFWGQWSDFRKENTDYQNMLVKDLL